MTPQISTVHPTYGRSRPMNDLLKIVFSDALEIVLEEEDYRLAHTLNEYLKKLEDGDKI